MKRTYFFIKNYKIDFITAIFGVVSAVLAFEFFDPKVQLIASVVIVSVSLLVIIFTRLRERNFIFSALTRRGDKDGWIGYGEFDISKTKKSFMLTNADPGYIHNECLTWTNYSIDFDFKIGNKCLGVILRAVNLANYVMMQITSSGIRPHIRINGGWKVWEAKETDLETNLSLDKWYKAQVSCDKSEVFIRLYEDGKSLFDRVWKIPGGNIVFSFKDGEDGNGLDIPFPINLEYGSAGFRNWRDEKAFVKNVLIQKL